MLLAELFQEEKSSNNSSQGNHVAIESAIKDMGLRVLKTDEIEVILRKRNDLEIVWIYKINLARCKNHAFESRFPYALSG